MNQEHKFFRCNICGNLVGLINNSGVPMICCGQKMQELIPHTTNGSYEKHLPVVTKMTGDSCCQIYKVNVGSIVHPMTKEHHIQFIYFQTENGGQRKNLQEEPSATFSICDDKPVAVFAYCNLHGIWKTEIK